jgi:HAD superfamily hydrolase (TIGR01490 family)
MRKSLALFDFDGTISSKDSFLYFLLFTHKLPQIAANVLRTSPSLVAYKLGFISNETAKQRLFKNFYGGVSKSEFDNWTANFLPHINSFVKQKALAQIQKHQQQGDRVIVVSAGFDLILQKWCDQQNIELLATRIAIDNDVITGYFASPNCYGAEKVNRVNSLLKLSEYENIYAYGDSRGDLEMIEIATHPAHSKKLFV